MGCGARVHKRRGRRITDGEDALDDEVVELLESRFVCFCESRRELLGRIRLRCLEGFAGEGEAAQEPHQTLGGRALLLALLAHNEELEGGALLGVGLIPGANFLRGNDMWFQERQGLGERSRAHGNVAL